MPKSKTTTRAVTVRFNSEEEQRLRASAAKLGYPTASELLREVLWKELGSRHEASDDAEQRMVATLDRLGRDISRSPRGRRPYSR
jgi:hypothetical protein